MIYDDVFTHLDLEKLQSQLSKALKDSMRGQKASIVISKPLPKQTTQIKVCTLKDADLCAAKGG
jgi:hypothetical protein